jgi:four helix bundle suffix protein
LLIDYLDFLRTHKLLEWSQGHPYSKRLRELNRQADASYETFKRGIENEDPAICANVIIGLIRVASYLLDKQIHKLELDFLKNSGLRERMTRARLAARNK